MFVIKSFKDKDTEGVFEGRPPKKLPQAVDRTETKLAALDAATNIEEMRSPPGNRLELLKGGRDGQWSVRINQQFRLCFFFEDGHAFDVEIVDYHD